MHSQICFLCRPEDESSRDYRERERDYERDQERILRERERLKRQEEERRRQKERYEKEKAFKRKEEEMKKEKEALRDKAKKTESTEPVGSSEKTEKKEEVVKRDRIRNKVLLFVKLVHFREDFFSLPASVKERANFLLVIEFLKMNFNCTFFSFLVGVLLLTYCRNFIHTSRTEEQHNTCHPASTIITSWPIFFPLYPSYHFWIIFKQILDRSFLL